MSLVNLYGVFVLSLSILLVAACAERDEAMAPELRADKILDAFYSFERSELVEVLAQVPALNDADRKNLLYYQGWAQGGQYSVVKRNPCQRQRNEVTCAVTVDDDFGAALGYQATDTFTFVFSAERNTPDGEPLQLTSLSFAGDDPPVFMALFEWISANQPETLTGPCDGMFADGQTPGACASAVASAAMEFSQIPLLPNIGDSEHRGQSKVPE